MKITETPPSKRVFIKTFGCQMNERDSVAMLGYLAPHGYVESSNALDSQLAIINTCTIRDKSHHKAFSEIGKLCELKQRDKNFIICVAGCVSVQQGEALWKRFPDIDLILGPDHIHKLPDFVERIKRDEDPIAETSFTTSLETPDVDTIVSNGVRAMITIMKGCDNACAFCIVPRVRGPELSRPMQEIVDEIQKFEEKGVKEVLLLGQNVNSYGKNLPGRATFAKLLRKIDEETKISRVRFTSPHPKDFNDDMFEEYRVNQRLCPQVHMPLQSGSSRILKRMRRSYTKDRFLDRVARLKEVRLGLSVTTDIIVGFPGETDKDYEDTLDVMRQVRFDGIFSFAYSSRPGTEAATFKDNVPEDIKHSRLLYLQRLQKEISLERNQKKVGTLQEVLVEGSSRRDPQTLTGRTPDGKIVNFTGEASLVGNLVDLKITQAYPHSLKGELS